LIFKQDGTAIAIV